MADFDRKRTEILADVTSLPKPKKTSILMDTPEVVIQFSECPLIIINTNNFSL